jgi:ribosomal protein S18 acetylase RimI-like enzyme
MNAKISSKITFRRATVNDALTLIDLQKRVAVPKLFNQFLFTAQEAEQEIRANILYLLEIDAIVIGSAAYRIRPDASVYINNITVAPQFRQRGIARAAIARIISENASAHRLDLCTHPDNSHALRLYSSFGFVIEGRHENYFGDGEPRLILAKLKNP